MAWWVGLQPDIGPHIGTDSLLIWQQIPHRREDTT